MEAVAKDNPAIKNVINRVYALSKDESERRLAEAREKQERDRIGQLEYAKEEGHAIGHAIGQARGIEIGKQDTARSMKADGEPIDKIARYTGLPEEVIAAL